MHGICQAARLWSDFNLPYGAIVQARRAVTLAARPIMTTGGLQFANIFVTDQGEVAIFSGSTPAVSWALQGVYQISPPLGPRCLLQAGGDLAIMTTDGITAISQVQTVDQIALKNTSVTIAIQPAWQDAVRARQGLSGWQILEWPL
jgi:hypothetical protein